MTAQVIFKLWVNGTETLLAPSTGGNIACATAVIVTSFSTMMVPVVIITVTLGEQLPSNSIYLLVFVPNWNNLNIV